MYLNQLILIMNSLISKLIANRNFQDFMGVARGLYRVIDASFPKDYRNQTYTQKSELNKQQKVTIISKTSPNSNETQSYKKDLKQAQKLYENALQNQTEFKSEMIISSVPSSSVHRAYQFSKLGVSLAGSMLGGYFKKKIGLTDQEPQLLNQANAKKITEVLCKMRGAPLKLAQALSIQQDKLIPKQIRLAFQKARQEAHVISKAQIQYMMIKSFGPDYREKYFEQFVEQPFAASSIGQVHFGIMKKDKKKVAIKIQYPNVKNSIDSDLINLNFLMNYTGIFPKTLFMDKIIENIRKELHEECDYITEKNKQIKYKNFIKNNAKFNVPQVIQELSSAEVLTCEFIEGVSMNDLENHSQEIRNEIAKRIMYLTFQELFIYRFMQTDPNPSNFSYDIKRDKLNLIDFGAAREYSQDFLDYYWQVIKGSVIKDQGLIWQASIKMGFVTGQQNITMKNAHIASIEIVGQPYRYDGLYDFGSQSMTEKVYKTMPLMLKNRLRPPPTEVYSLHRKLSGSYLLCIRLKAKVNCKQIYESINRRYKIKKQNVL